MHDAQLLGNETMLGTARAPASTRRLFRAQGFDHSLLEPAMRMSKDRRVDRFIADALAWIIGVRSTKSGRNHQVDGLGARDLELQP